MQKCGIVAKPSEAFVTPIAEQSAHSASRVIMVYVENFIGSFVTDRACATLCGNLLGEGNVSKTVFAS